MPLALILLFGCSSLTTPATCEDACREWLAPCTADAVTDTLSACDACDDLSARDADAYVECVNAAASEADTAAYGWDADACHVVWGECGLPGSTGSG